MPKLSDIPVCPEAPTERSSGLAMREYQISLVTPLFGGGVEAGVPDAASPVRGSSIRGQLQFWWRATKGAAFVRREDLFARHAAIWGTTDRASPVEVGVRNVVWGEQVRRCARYEWNQSARQGQGAWRLAWEAPFARSALPYALFPFQGKQPASGHGRPEKDPAEFIDSLSFVLQLRYPEAFASEVQTAVWAWVNFGGLGARTRRGCGALLCEELAPKDASIGSLRTGLQTHLMNDDHGVRDWPIMPNGFCVDLRPGDPIDAWARVVGVLQTFRQGQGFARNNGAHANRPGRSRYPEPETIRRATGQRSTRHARLMDIPDDAFPRAAFGLPIVVHFQGRDDPPDTVLYPANGPDGARRERMASPLIVKPLALADGRAVPLALRLAAPSPTNVDLRRGDDSLVLPESTEVAATRLATYRNSPLAGSASGSALEAFMQYTRDNGFREITR